MALNVWKYCTWRFPAGVRSPLARHRFHSSRIAALNGAFHDTSAGCRKNVHPAGMNTTSHSISSILSLVACALCTLAWSSTTSRGTSSWFGPTIFRNHQSIVSVVIHPLRLQVTRTLAGIRRLVTTRGGILPGI